MESFGVLYTKLLIETESLIPAIHEFAQNYLT